MPLPPSFWTQKSQRQGVRIQSRSQSGRLRSPSSYIRTAIKTPLREVLRSLPALGPRRLYLYLPLAYPLPCNCSGARPLTNERPLDLIQWGINRLSEAGSRRHFDHGQTSSLALPADSRLRSYRRRDLSTNFPTFVQRFYLTQSQGNSCTSHPHTQASPS